MPCDCERILVQLRAELAAVHVELVAACTEFERRQQTALDVFEGKQEALLANVDRQVRSIFARIEAAIQPAEQKQEPPACH